MNPSSGSAGRLGAPPDGAVDEPEGSGTAPNVATPGRPSDGPPPATAADATPLEGASAADGSGPQRTLAADSIEEQRATARLILADRMAALGALAGGIAHAINNPLASVIGGIDFARHELGEIGVGAASPERHAEIDQALVSARAGAERVQRTVRDLWAFAQVGRDDRRGPVVVREVLESSIAVAWNEIRHRARLVTDIGDLPNVEATEARIAQVFLNLLVNAAQAIPEGAADHHEIRVVAWTAKDGRVVVEVHDTGVGIEPAVLARVFDPFFTTKAQGVGVGLGLSVCHGIVRSLGGEIAAESSGAGTVVRVTLPPAAAPSPPPSAPPSHDVTPGRARVLIIDDDELVGASLRRAVGRGHDVRVVTSGREAVAILASGERFDVIFCDLMMPEMTGMDVHAAVARLAPELVDRMVFMTGGAFTDVARAFLESAPGRRLDKPFDLQAVRALVQAMSPASG